MTDRKLVLFLLFIVALCLNALTVPDLKSESASALRQDKTLIKTPSDLAWPRISELLFEGEISAVEIPVIVRKTFITYENLAVTSDKKSVILSIKSQGPPVA